MITKNKNRNVYLFFALFLSQVLCLVVFFYFYYQTLQSTYFVLKEKSPFQVVHLGDHTTITSFATVVTALYRFNESKHTSQSYDIWSQILIKSIGVPLVAFLDNETAQSFIPQCILNNITGQK